MEQLNRDIVNILRKNNDDWVEAIKEGQETKQGIDMGQVVGKNAERFEQVNTAFNAYHERHKKKRWF
jgi:hypothetical protein